MNELILIRGLPGSGKTTLGQRLTGLIGIHLEADMFFTEDDGTYTFIPERVPRAHLWCQSEAMRAMELQQPLVVVSNTFTRKDEMKFYLDIARDYGYTTVIYECHNNFGSIHNVPQSSIDKMKARWECL